MVSVLPVNRNRVAPRILVRVLFALSLIAVMGEISFIAKVPLLFASMGPTLLSVVSRPALKQNRPTSIIGGHFFGTSVALVLLFLFGLGASSSVQSEFTQPRIIVAVLAIGITTVFEDHTPFYHPPAASTTLLVSLGFMSTAPDVLAIFVGILIIAFAAMVFEYLCPKKSTEEIREISSKFVSAG